MTNRVDEVAISTLESTVSQILNEKTHTHGLGRALRLLNKELALYKNHIDGTKDWDSTKFINRFEKVQIGGGKHTLEGFFNIDIVPPADLVCDVREGIPLPDACSSFVFSEHFLEHIDYPVSVKKVAGELGRILRQGGQLVLGVPDSELAAKSYIAKDMDFYNRAMETWYANRNCNEDFNTYIDLLNYHFRDQDDDPKYNPHFWAYDFEKLESLFKGVGFSYVSPWKFDPNIANPKREYGSVYILATK